MARNWWDTLWGVPEKQVSTSYSGQVPMGGISEVAHNTGFPIGNKLTEETYKFLQPESWGFPKGYIEKTTSPFVQELLNRYPKTQREVQDIYSARGLGRSTAVARDLGEGAQQRDLDINKIMAQAYEKDLAQRKQDQLNALNQGTQFSELEKSFRNSASSFDMDKFKAQNQAIGEYNDIGDKETSAMNRMIAAPLAIGASVATGNPSFSLDAFGGGSTSPDVDKLMRYIDQADKIQASPFIKNLFAGKGLPQQIGSYTGYRS